MQKGQTQVLILAGIVILIAVAGGIFFLGRITAPKSQPQNVITSSPQPSPLSTEAPAKVEDPTPNWKIYTNKEIGFSIKYPNNYEVNESGVIPKTQANNIRLTNGKVSLEIFDYDTGVDQKILKTEQTIIDNEPVRINYFILEAFPNQTGFILASLGPRGRKFTISLQALESKPLTQEEINIFNQILSTFKFLD